MGNVVLLAINAKYVHSPLAAWLLAGGVARYSRMLHDVEVVETTINDSIGDIAAKVAAKAPNVIGVSTYIWNAAVLPGLIGELRKLLPDSVIVFGGPEATHDAEHWLRQGSDYVLRGEGERSFPLLLDILAGGTFADLESVPGLCFARDSEARINPHSAPDEDTIILIEDFVDPYSDAYIETLDGRIAYIEASRGCPFRCAYCLSADSGVRFIPPDAVKRQIDTLASSGARTVKFVDRTFNCDAARAYGIFEYIIGLECGCSFHFEIAADLLDERTLSLLRSAVPGRIQVETGLQSFFLPALEAVSRRTDLGKAERNIQTLVCGQNIHVHVDLIAGLPYETLADFQDSFDRAYSLCPHTLQLGFLKLLHGSRLRREAESFGIEYCEKPPYEISRSPWISDSDLATLKQTENALARTYNKGRFLSVLKYALSASGLRPFSFYHALSKADRARWQEGAGHGVALDAFADLIFGFCAELPNVDERELRDRMICDWLGMVKGKNMPPFLRGATAARQDGTDRSPRRSAAKGLSPSSIGKDILGRVIEKNEAAFLSSGVCAVVDSNDRNPVTGLYRLHFRE